MEYGIHNRVFAKVALDLQAIASDTTTVGNIIDTKGFGSIEFVGIAKAITDGNYALKLEDGDDSGLSDADDVPAANLLGDLFAFGIEDDDAAKRTGAISKKRYLRASLVSTGVTTGVDSIGIMAILGHPDTIPTDEQSVAVIA